MSNRIRITGYIGKGEVRVTPGGRTVCNFSVADQLGYGDDAKTQWIECSIWGKRAENPKLTDMLVKGSKVTVEGQIELIPADGQYPAKLKMPFVGDIVHITPKMLGSGGGTWSATATSKGTGQPTPTIHDFDDFDDEIPFNHAL